MYRFDLFLVGKSAALPLEAEVNDLPSLADIVIRQRCLIGRFSAEAGDRALQRVMIPLFRIDLLCESEP